MSENDWMDKTSSEAELTSGNALENADEAPADETPADEAELTSGNALENADETPADETPADEVELASGNALENADEAPADETPAETPSSIATHEPAPEEESESVTEARPEITSLEDEQGDLADPPPNPRHKWYILQAYSGFEHRVQRIIEEKLKLEQLEQLVGEIFVPGEDVERVKNGKKHMVHVIYYPGYVLIRMELTEALWHLLMNIPRVSGFVGGTNLEPRALEDAELGAIRSQMNQGMRDVVFKDQFEVGQQVMIIDGPFANFSGKIDEVNTEKSKLRVLISILGRSTPVELNFDKVKEHLDST